MLLVQDYLRTHTFGELYADHQVEISFAKSGQKFSLNYDMLSAKDDNPLTNQCRGLILAPTDNYNLRLKAKEVNGRLNYDDVCPGETAIVAYPFDRFFNYQAGVREIDWTKDFEILEKLDGTLCQVYQDPNTNQWCVATRSSPEADIPINICNYTFRSLFEHALKDTVDKSFEELTDSLDPKVTYMFELMTPLNEIVVKHADYKIALLGARNKVSLQEIDIATLNLWLPMVKIHSSEEFKDNGTFNLSLFLKWIDDRDLAHEGVVVKQLQDGKVNRIKIKSDVYRFAHMCRSSLGASDRNCMEMLLSEKEDDVIPVLPPILVKHVIEMKTGLIKLIANHEALYTKLKSQADSQNLGDKKTFALLVGECKDVIKGYFFMRFDGKVSSFKDYLQRSQRQGAWSPGFLDSILELARKI